MTASITGTRNVALLLAVCCTRDTARERHARDLNPVRPAERVVSGSEVDSHGVPGSQTFLSAFEKGGGNTDVALALDLNSS
jgi:hypothetical protein